MQISHLLDRLPAIERQALIWFAALFVVGLLPALLNGFPLYHHDSAAYSGGYPLVDGYRTAIPAGLAKLILPLFGPWSLPVINAILLGVVTVRFASIFLPHVRMEIVILAFCATAVPIFVSAIMPDIWIAFAYLTLLMLMVRFSWLDFAICVVMVTGHGMNLYLFISTMFLVAVVLRDQRWRSVRLIAAVAVGAILLEAIVNLAVRKDAFPPKMGAAVIASKAINDVPAAYGAFCAKSPQEKICLLHEKVEARRAAGDDRDDQYIWRAGLMPWDGPPAETLSLDEFNATGAKLGWFVLKTFPLEYLEASFRDYQRMLSGRHCFPSGWGYVERTPDTLRWIGYLVSRDSNTLAQRGFFKNTVLCSSLAAAKSFVFALATLAALWAAFHHAGRLRQQMFVLLGAVYANDIAFALSSDGAPRYHDRGLMLCAIILLLVFNDWRARRGKIAARV